MAVVINTITTLDKLSLINSNFTKLAAAINQSLVWRNGNVAGETQLTRDLDFNGYSILNAYVNGTSLGDVVDLAAASGPASLAAQASAEAAAESATDAATSANSALIAMASIGNPVDKTISIFSLNSLVTMYQSRGFYTEGDGGAGKWISTGVTNTSLAGTHVPKTARLYDAAGHEYKLVVASGDTVEARANGALAVSDYTIDTDNFVCIGEVAYGILSQVKNYYSTNDGRTSIKILFGGNYSYRIGKMPIKLFTRSTYDFNDSHFYVSPSTTYKAAMALGTAPPLNAMERGITDVQYISSIYAGAAGYGRLTLTGVRIMGGNFYGDHTVSLALSSTYCGTGLYTFNAENILVTNTEFRQFTWSMQLGRTNKGSYYDYRGNTVNSSVIAEADAGGLGSYEGVHLQDVRSFDAKYGHLRHQSNWSSYTNCHFENQVTWSSNPDGNQLNYFVENLAAGVSWTGGALQCTSAAKAPLKGMVYDKARGSSYTSLYLEYWGPIAFVLGIPASSFYNRTQGINIDTLGSLYSGTTAGKAVIGFESGYFGSYNSAGLYSTGGWETMYDYYSGANSWRYGAPTVDAGAFPHGGFDFKYGTYNMYYSGSLPDIDFLRDTPSGNEFLTPYGALVNSGSLRFPMGSPAHMSNVIVWIKDLTGTFSPRNIVLNQYNNNNTADGTGVNVFRTYGTAWFDYGNGYKAILVPNVNPRPLDSRMYTSSGNKLEINVTSTAPIIIKQIQSFVGGVPLFPSPLPDYVPNSAATRLWGTQSTGSVDSPVFYGKLQGGGIFKPGDVINPWVPYSNSDLTNPNSYSSQVSNYGSSIEQQTITGGYTLGGAMAGQTFALTIASVDTTNSLTTVTVPTSNLPYVVMGMPINITANSGGGTTGDIYIKSRVVNSDGTLSANYVLFGNLGAVGGTLTVSTTKSYTMATGVTTKLSGTTQQWATPKVVLNYNSGVSQNTALEYYYAGGTTKTAFIQQDSSLRMTYSAAGHTLTGGTVIVANNFLPDTTATRSIGSASLAFNNIYTQNAVTVVSDRNYKTSIQEIPDEVLDVWGTLSYSMWQLNTSVALKGADDARFHFGIVAQDIKEKFEAAGLDATKYGILIHDSWEAQEEIVDSWDEVVEVVPAVDAAYDADGNVVVEAQEEVKVVVKEAGSLVVQEAREAGEIWMVRMEECLSIESAYLRRRMDRQDALIASISSN